MKTPFGEEQMKQKQISFLFGMLMIGMIILTACAPQTVTVEVEVTRQVEVEVIQEVEVEVTRQVEVEVEVVREVEVEVTPIPIGGEVLLYGCLFDPDKMQVLKNTFMSLTGVEVICLEMSGGEALQRIRAESENPQADVLFGGGASHINLATEGLLEPWKNPAWQSLADGPLKDPDGYWTGFYMGVMGFACSPERLAEIEAECPDSWEDLLDPIYEGEVVIASPGASGTAYSVLNGLATLYGEDGAFEYWAELDKNVDQYTSSGGQPGRLAVAGEYAVGISFAHDIQVAIDKGQPGILNFPSEGTVFEIGSVSIIAGAKNRAAAEAWINFVLSETFQAYHSEVAHRIPVLEGVEVGEGEYGLEDVTLIDGYNPNIWALERDRLVARWQEEIGSLRE